MTSPGTASWNGRRVLVTGGASFIGSHLVEQLVARGADVRVVDNLSSGKHEYLQALIDDDSVRFEYGDLCVPGVADAAVRGAEVVFHLAADHGGRGYVDLHQADCASNLALDGIVFLACRDHDVEKVVYASSGCVYPNHRQTDPDAIVYLSEDLVAPPYDSDNLYGYAKLMAELTLKAYCSEWGMKAASCRYFTVYGERGKENHAVTAMIARAFVKQSPYQVWGTGRQVRNWTYVGDIVRGTILAAERVDDGTAVNLGTMERTRVIDAVHEVMEYTGHRAPIEFAPWMPTGPMNRVADNSLARRLLDWEPQVTFKDGLRRMTDWYFDTHDRNHVRALIEQGALIERHVIAAVA